MTHATPPSGNPFLDLDNEGPAHAPIEPVPTPAVPVAAPAVEEPAPIDATPTPEPVQVEVTEPAPVIPEPIEPEPDPASGFVVEDIAARFVIDDGEEAAIDLPVDPEPVIEDEPSPPDVVPYSEVAAIETIEPTPAPAVVEVVETRPMPVSTVPEVRTPITVPVPRRPFPWKWAAVGGAVLVVAGVGAFWLSRDPAPVAPPVAVAPVKPTPAPVVVEPAPEPVVVEPTPVVVEPAPVVPEPAQPEPAPEPSSKESPAKPTAPVAQDSKPKPRPAKKPTPAPKPAEPEKTWQDDALDQLDDLEKRL